VLVTFVLSAHWMKMKSRRGSSDALHALFNLVPPKARVLRNDKEVEVPTSEVVRGDVVVLRPGDRVPVDGEVVEGTTSMDESLVTGESLPVEKKPGDHVGGGGVPFVTALTFAISAVVIACPDALGLATPTAVAVGTGLGARHNILITDAATLEGVSRIDTIVLDKTGTITLGAP